LFLLCISWVASSQERRLEFDGAHGKATEAFPHRAQDELAAYIAQNGGAPLAPAS
jgi:hypothetical protein